MEPRAASVAPAASRVRAAERLAVDAASEVAPSRGRSDGPDAREAVAAPTTLAELRNEPAEREIPPNWVFAPGFLYADRRGLVPYPGLPLGDGSVFGHVVTRYLEEKQRLARAADTYRAAALPPESAAGRGRATPTQGIPSSA
jgi:hypothetical protein